MRFVTLFLAVAALWAGEWKLPAEFETPARLALSAPPELAADALLRLLESGRIADRETAPAMIGQAFDLGAQAHLRAAMQAPGMAPADTRSGSQAKAYALRLDAATLQSRAVLAMLGVDARKAREMFQAMAQPELRPLACEDALVYDVGSVYRALGAVARSGFNAKERARQDHVAFLLQYTAAVHSPAQVLPMLDAIQSAGLSPVESSAVMVRLSGQLEAMAGDARSFVATLDDLASKIPPQMAASFQKYVDTNRSATACALDAAKPDPYWRPAAAQRLLAGAQRLRFGGSGSKVLSDAERATPEWKQQLEDFEKELASWQPAPEETEADFYQQKGIVYEALVELIPAGPERDRALAEFFSFVKASNLQSKSPAEWLLPVAAMLERVRNTSGGEPEKVLSAMEGSGSVALALYASLERALDPGYPSWVLQSR